jgi:hypothetical protein
MVEPPETLTSGVMARIQADNAAPAPENTANTIEALSPRGKRVVRRWPSYVAAACLVVLIGAGLTTALRSTTNTANDTAEAMPETAMAAVADEDSTAQTTTEQTDEAAPAQRAATGTTRFYGLSDEDGTEAATADSGSAYSYSMAERAPAEDVEEDPMGNGSTHSILNPDQVPEGREADFEALLTDAGWPDGELDVTWHSLYAAEYHGVIYEFLTDDQQQYLLWHDAAEGLYTHSQATVDDLWSIFDN